jgi:hypothetical protein
VALAFFNSLRVNLHFFGTWQPSVHLLPVVCAITATGKGAFIDFFEQLFSSGFLLQMFI